MPVWMKRPNAGFDLVTKVALVGIGAALLTLAIAAVAWLNFQQMGATQRAIIDDALPAMDAAQAVAHFNLSLSERIDQLASAPDAATIERRQRELDTAFVELRRLVDRLAGQGFDRSLRGQLATALDALDAQRTELAETSTRALALGLQETAAAAAHRDAIVALRESAETLAAGASAAATATVTSLYVLPAAEKAKPVMLDALDRLIEVDIDLMERASELQQTGLALEGALDRLALADDPSALPALREQASSALDVLARRVDSIGDQEHRLRTSRHVRQLATSLNDDGVFALRRQQLELSRRISAQRAGIVRLSAQMNAQAGALIDAASRTINEASRASRDAVNRAMFGFLAAAALLGAALVATLWTVFRRHVQHHVKAMESAVHALAAGDYDVPVSVDTSGPLAPLGDALEQCRMAHLRRQRTQTSPAGH